MTSRAQFCLIAAACLLPSVAGAAPVTLSVVNVNGQQIKCVFEADCTIPETDGSTSFAIPGSSGNAVLHTRSFAGKGGIPVSIKHAYQYRVDLSGVTTLGDATCVLGLEIDFGPVLKLQYNNTGPLDDVFVINVGGPGTIGVSSATQDHNVVTVTFAQPVCAADGVTQGKSSFFFGLASASAPAIRNAKVLVNGFDIPNVRSAAPSH